MLFGDHCFLSLKCLIIGDNVVDSNFHEKEKKKKNYLLTSRSIPLQEILWETNAAAPALFTCFCGERSPARPGLLVFLSVLPSQACDRGLWVRCDVWAMSGESATPAQPGASRPLEEASFSFLWFRAQEAPPPTTPSGAPAAHASMSPALGDLPEVHLYPQSCVGIK